MYFSVGMFLAGLLLWELLGCFESGFAMDKELSTWNMILISSLKADEVEGAKVMKSSVSVVTKLIRHLPGVMRR